VTPRRPLHPRTLDYLRPTLLAAALLAAGLHAQDALALGLGAIRTKSVIGEPFRAEINVLGEGEAVPASTCFSINAPATAAADDLPWLSSARIRTQGRTVFISSAQAINEPILMVGLRIGCGFELAREYAVLMQPSGAPQIEDTVAPAPIAPAAVPTRRAAASTPINAPTDAVANDQPAQPKPKPERKTRRQKEAVTVDRLWVAPNADDGNGLKMSGGLSRRAEASEAQREVLRTEQRLLAALDEQIATHLAIADKVKQLEARMAELQKQLGRTEASIDAALPPVQAAATPATDRREVTPEAPAAAPLEPDALTQAASTDDSPAVESTAADTSSNQEVVAAPPPGLTNEPVRVINKLPPDPVPDAPEASGMNWLVAALGALAAGSVLGGAWIWRRRARKLAATAALRSRHAEEAITRMMMSQTLPPLPADAQAAQDDVDTTAWTPPRQQAPEYPVEPATGAPETASFEHFPGEAPAENIQDLDIAQQRPVADAATSGDAAGVDFELGQIDANEAGTPIRLDLEFDSFTGSTSSLGVTEPVAAPLGPRLVSSTATTTSALSFDQTARPANEEAPPSPEHVLELAEIMMSFGRAEGAAQTLSEFLRDYPKESIIPWLKLLDLYHSSGRRGEYDDLAPKLNRAFNAKVPDWEHFSGPTTSESVEQFGHIMARINASWPNQDCLDYLVELLRDNRAGARVGFPLGVIDDILLLKAMLEWLIANPSITETQTSRLALL
jgi:TolA-binding protein